MLEINNLCSGYRGVQVLNEVSLNVPKGEIITLIGANGAGKTTMMRTLSGTVETMSGTILFQGKPIEFRPTHYRVEKGLIHCPEGRELFPNMTVEENLLLGAYTIKTKDKIRENFEKVYNVFPRLYERKSQRAGTLSGGEQQMCAIGRGVMADPKLLILDEPSLGLSPKLTEEMFVLIMQINQTLKTTILLVEQKVADTLEIATYGYVLQTGRIVAEGPAAELKNNSIIHKAYLGI
ncbi:ABC transporter ATP-binding protein [Peribacillus loiseleuriae]|uniref:ABC transporter domain-containing protein n=1 Tax=Peribacillus loiseleuriae TaxID=1679170 RepID=A0A0K9GSW5_9BACI|nr:ABC transporter ATP-binding protein [Peribacillus loiseleuriae]KMY49733.1 hypothetical protein AC625_09440 [Peribacillus loiseleuriae]